VVRLAGNVQDQVPPAVSRYLLPHERQVIAVRRHPAVLLGPFGQLAGAAATAGLVTATRRKDAAALRGAWGAAGIALLISAIRLRAWLSSYVVMTNSRLLYIDSLVSVKVRAIPLSAVRAIELRRSFFGRLLGYGTFVVKTAGRDEKIRVLPYPEQLYLEVCGTLTPGGDD
jgi:Bacterial PH domain